MVAKQGVPKLQPTKECPFVTDSMQRMLYAFQSGGYDDLANEMYKINAENLAKANTARQANASLRTFTKAAMVELDNDGRPPGKRHLATLLHTVDSMHIESMKKGKFACDYHNVQSSKDKLYSLNNVTGVYLVTFTVKDRKGLGLHPKEIEKMRDHISRYYEDLGNEVPDDSHPNYQQRLENAELAAKLETIYQSSSARSNSARGYDSKRALAFDRHETLLDTLNERTLQEPDGRTRQHQCLIQIGCSTELAARVSHHDPLQGLSSGTAKPYSLVLRCLKDAGVVVQSLRVPVVKVWEMGQLEIAEIGFTLLCSSLFNDGGLNCIGGGGRKGIDEPDKWGAVRTEVFLEKDILSENLDASDKILQSRHEILDRAIWLKNDKSPEPQRIQAETLSKDADDLIERMEGSTEVVQAKIDAIEAASKEARRRTAQVKNTTANYEGYVAFRKNVRNWLDKSKSRREDPPV